MSNINNEKLIYCSCPGGSWIRVNQYLRHLGLDNDKVIKNISLFHFKTNINNKKFESNYDDLDVLIIDEFYDCSNEIIDAINELINKGKQIVLASHNTIDELDYFSRNFKNRLKYYDMDYSLDYVLDFRKYNYIDLDGIKNC